MVKTRKPVRGNTVIARIHGKGSLTEGLELNRPSWSSVGHVHDGGSG